MLGNSQSCHRRADQPRKTWCALSFYRITHSLNTLLDEVLPLLTTPARISKLLKRIEDSHSDVRKSAISALVQLADYGASIHCFGCYLL